MKHFDKKIWLVLIICAIVGITFLWQQDTQKKQELFGNDTSMRYISPAAEFIITIPNGWEIDQDSSAEDQGLISLLINGPDNKNISKNFSDESSFDTQNLDELLTSDRLEELINTPYGKNFVLLQVDALTTAFYEIPTSKDVWLSEVNGGLDISSGSSVSNIEDFKSEGAEGYKYNLTIIKDSKKLEAIGYYLLGESAEAEFLVFPASSSRLSEAENIIKTTVISPDLFEEAINQEL